MAIGYLCSITYILAILLLGILLRNKFGVFISRKVVHILAGFLWLICNCFFKYKIHHFFIYLFVLLVLISVKFITKNKVNKIFGSINGLIYYILSIILLLTISFKIETIDKYITCAILVLSFGDAFAALIGSKIGKLKIYKNKSFVGFISCILTSFITLFVCNYFLKLSIDFIFLIFVAISTGIFELVSKELDNLTIPFTTTILLYLYSKGTSIMNPLIVFVLIFLICFCMKIMSYYGSLLAAFIGASYLYIGGIKPLIYILMLYVLLLVVQSIKKKKVNTFEEKIVKKTKEKDFLQVLANGFMSLLFLYFSYFMKNQEFIIMSLIVFSNSFVDSLASEIGILSKRKPYDVFKRKKVIPGTSGGMTLLGTTISIIASILFSLTIFLIYNSEIAVFVISALSMILCCFLDSFLGSVIQVKYKCLKCGLITEKEYHCGQPTKIESGIQYIDNDIVNLICNIVCGLTTLLIVCL